MSTIDSSVMLLTIGDRATGRRLPFHGSRPGSRLARVPAALAAVPSVRLPARPGRDDLDPLLDEQRPGRLVVSGTDADLAAVLIRLLRRDLLGEVEVAFVPATRRSAAAVAWGLPRDRAAAAALALDGTAAPVPLIRDDSGGVLVGRGEVRNLRGEVYCDNTLVVRGTVRRLLAAPGPQGVSAPAGRGIIRPATGRALQIGCVGATVVVDGVAHPREVSRWTWYQHTADWLLVRP